MIQSGYVREKRLDPERPLFRQANGLLGVRLLVDHVFELIGVEC